MIVVVRDELTSLDDATIFVTLATSFILGFLPKLYHKPHSEMASPPFPVSFPLIVAEESVTAVGAS